MCPVPAYHFAATAHDCPACVVGIIADGAFGGSGEGQLQLSYIDSEGDRCAIGWDQELTEAQRDAEEDGRLLKILVEEGSAAQG